MGVMNVVVQKEREDVFAVGINVPRRFLLLSKNFEDLKLSPRRSTQQWLPLATTFTFWDGNRFDPEKIAL